MKQIIITTIFILFLVDYSLANDEKENNIVLDTITVEGKYDKDNFQTGDVDTEEISSFYTVIKKDDFHGKMDDLAEILKKEASIHVYRSSGLGSYSTISIRGSSSDQVMVYMDGILLNDASGGGVDLSNISISDIESIEIFRGITPLNFGKSSIGGVVNIKTNRIKEGLGCSIRTGYGSFNTYNINTFLSHKPGKYDYIISFDSYGSDNDYEVQTSSSENPSESNTEKRKSDNFYQKNLLFKFGYDFSESLRLDFLNQSFSKTKYFPVASNLKTNTHYDTKKNSTVLKLTADKIGSFNMYASFGFSWNDDRYDDSDGIVGSIYGLGKQEMKYVTIDYNFNYYLEYLSDIYFFRLILDTRREKYTQKDIINHKEADCYRNFYSLGLQNTFLLLNERLNIMPAFRLSFIKDINDVSLYKSKDYKLIENGQNNDVQRKDYFSPQLGIKYIALDWLMFKTNIGKYYREPSFFERFGDRGHFYGNPMLKAEKGLNFDIGLDMNFAVDYDWFDSYSISAAYYRSEISNIITREYDSGGSGRSVNQSKGEIVGFETKINIKCFYIFDFIANAVWQDPKNLDSKLRKIDDGNYKKLAGRFKDSYLGRIESKYKGFKTYIEYIRQSGIYYDSINHLPRKKGGALKKEINIGLSYMYNSFLFSLECNNLNDDQYDDLGYSGKYLNPGRSIFYTINYKY